MKSVCGVFTGKCQGCFSSGELRCAQTSRLELAYLCLHTSPAQGGLNSFPWASLDRPWTEPLQSIGLLCRFLKLTTSVSWVSWGSYPKSSGWVQTLSLNLNHNGGRRESQYHPLYRWETEDHEFTSLRYTANGQ